ncbi:MAG TPA: MmcQ/YjbR family DNA-binding protein [Ferruginibacter sp.]|nr:MmcQ/YjbR family DNA-binding protein [Ferruginibacter sp.]HMP20222.1 MmcQ/YjbR family DNA-binding protein [Ferruginibacter sp.]
MPDVEQLREYALRLKEVAEGFPFGEDTLVFKVNNRIFLLLALDTQPLRFNVKCDPEKAIELREAYPLSVLPGYHMNKKHWNTVVVDGSIPKAALLQMIEDSYRLVKGKKK